MRPRKTLEGGNDKFYFDGVSAEKLVEEYGTPLYVLSETRIRENYRKIHNALSRDCEKVRVLYAAKANTNISVLKILVQEGSHIDVVSQGEVFLALKAGFIPERILYTGTSVRNEEIEFLLKSKVTINIDSISQLDRLLRLTTPDILSFRINPEIGAGHHEHVVTAGRDSKFGLWENDAVRAYKKARKAGVNKFGMQMHMGSGILKKEDIDVFILGVRKLLATAKKVHETTGAEFEFIDVGGGIGVPYKPTEKEIDINRFSNELTSLFQKTIKEYNIGEPFLCVEPGRYIVCDAGIILTKVNTVKIAPFKNFLGVDASLNTLIRPALYGAYHHIQIANRRGSGEKKTYDVVGPICESADFLAIDRKLPKVYEGDILAILNAGAYGYCMSSQYNSRPRAAEVLVKEGKCSLIRERETLDSLLVGQKTAKWLK